MNMDIEYSWADDLTYDHLEIIDKVAIQSVKLDPSLVKSMSTDGDMQQTDHSGIDNHTRHVAKEEYVYIEDILQKNLDLMSSNDILKDECWIITFTQQLLEGNNFTKVKTLKEHSMEFNIDKINDIITYLEWMSTASGLLAQRIKQETVNYVPENPLNPSIVRSSYNFCTKNTQCKKFYCRNETPTCNEHHYVHNVLKYDIDSVVYFLKHVLSEEPMPTPLADLDHLTQNLSLSIKTICFVIRHMSKELNCIDYVTKSNSEVFHRSNPTSFNL